MQRSSVDLPEPEAPISATAWCSRDVEVDPAQDLALAERLGHPADLEHRALPAALAHRDRPLGAAHAVDEPRQRDRDRQVEQRGGDQRRVVEVRTWMIWAVRNASCGPRIETRATSFCSATKSLSSGGATRRTACGRITWRSAWRLGQPDRERRVALAAVDRADPGAVDLGDVGAVGERRGRSRRARPGRSAARSAASAGTPKPTR